MYILLISRGVPSDEDPQWGCFEFDQARALASIGHKVVVMSVDERLRFSSTLYGLSYKKVDGVAFYNYRFFPKKVSNLCGFKISSKITEYQYIYLLKKIIQEQGVPDVLYSHYLNTSYICVQLKKMFNIPLVGIEHWSELAKDQLIPLAKKVGDLTYGNVDKLISVSDGLQFMIKKHFGKDSVVINNMVSSDFCQGEVKFNNNCDKVEFVTIGSLIHRKGFDLLIDAFIKLNLPKDKWKLSIIGGGGDFEKLQNRIQSTNLQDNIHLLGSKTKAEIVKILQRSDVFVLASRKETFGVVYIEAMMLGLPVIASICGGPEEFVQKKDGLLVPVNDVDALADAIKYMFVNYQSYDRAKIAEDCKNRFSPEVIARQLTDIFEKVVEEHKQKNSK